MRTLTRALQAEAQKLKRSLVIWLTLLTPAALIFLEVAAGTQRQGTWLTPDTNRWEYIFEDVISLWVILVYPLFITLVTALLGQLEHSSQTWKLTHTQPVPRWATFAAKQLWALALSTLGMLALIGLTLLGGLILDILMPEFLIEPPIPWGQIFKQAGIAFLGGGIILAIHNWLALHSRSFVVASALGIGMTISGLILQGMQGMEYFPWSLPATALHQYYLGGALAPYLFAGAGGWLGLSLLGNLLLTRKEITV